MHGSLPALRCQPSVLRSELYSLMELLGGVCSPLRVGIDNSTGQRSQARAKMVPLPPTAPCRSLDPHL
eukprot:4883423-Pyramimonas_sp.AAC.1